MGNGGKFEERARARLLRAEAWTLAEIATELDVAKSSVSRWVRDVPFEPRPRNRGASGHAPHPGAIARAEHEEACKTAGIERFASLSDDAFFAAGVALYVGEGSKTNGTVSLANTNADVIAFFCRWLRESFAIDETRLRGQLYLHDMLPLQPAHDHWSAVSGIPQSQFVKPYRSKPSGGRMRAKHQFGCFTVRYASRSLAREVLGLCSGLLYSSVPDPG